MGAYRQGCCIEGCCWREVNASLLLLQGFSFITGGPFSLVSSEMRVGVGRRGLHRFATNGAASAYPNSHVVVRKTSGVKGFRFSDVRLPKEAWVAPPNKAPFVAQRCKPFGGATQASPPRQRKAKRKSKRALALPASQSLVQLRRRPQQLTQHLRA